MSVYGAASSARLLGEYFHTSSGRPQCCKGDISPKEAGSARQGNLPESTQLSYSTKLPGLMVTVKASDSLSTYCVPWQAS